MSDVVIRVENVSKQYHLGKIGTGTLKDDVNRWWHSIRGKEDPYLKIGEVNDRTKKGGSEYVWALKDISFDVKQGDVVGIIGKNGAGKSTLLKILSRTTLPTTGSLKIKGRVASLLEVGTGFHPDLTGRENIFLNGAILGMTKAEIKSKFDEMVDFSGVEKYIDTPVKRYSSGMYVRLAFAVAAHLEPEILIVDEVLAVGDAEFQKKCLGKMKDVSVKDGRTVLFVSHNVSAIKTLCNVGVLLTNGNISVNGLVSQALKGYLELNELNKEKILNEKSITTSDIIDASIEIYYHELNLYSDIDITATLTFQNHVDLDDCYINFVVEDHLNNFIIHHRSDFTMKQNPCFKVGRHNAILNMPHINLKAGTYNFWFRIYCKKKYDDFIIDSDKRAFEVEGKVSGGLINANATWKIN